MSSNRDRRRTSRHFFQEHAMPFRGPVISILSLFLVASGASLTAKSASAQVAEYAVQVSAEVLEDPPQIAFSWPTDATAERYYVYKKSPNDTCWGEPIAQLDGSAVEYTDTQVGIGQAYEYAFYKNLQSFSDTVVIANGTQVVFTIHDSWGDGICCDRGLGSYRVAGNETTYASGGDFGEHEGVLFTADGGQSTLTDTVIVSITLDIFGEETTWELTEYPSGTVLSSGGPYESPRFGHIFAGIRYPLIESRGTVLLIIDDAVCSQLTEELDRLETDLIGDGWRVRRLIVSRADPVSFTRDRIIDQCAGDASVTTVFLLGHIPVPYSGNVMAAHTDHRGAYPADVYYAELDGPWTDDSVTNTTASRPQNHNVPGDGKFDQTLIPSNVDLSIGRVDLFDLPAFSLSETELLRRYLDKNHAFRHGLNNARRRGLIDDNVGVLWGLAVTGIGLRNFSAMFGPAQVHHLDYLSTMADESYLWSQGCGGGSYVSCAGVATSYDFTSETVRTVFTMLYGSYFGDWDVTNNLMRAALGSENSLLACCFAGAPAWHFHHIVLGQTIGYSARLTQNNASLYTPTDRARQVHIALLGDPTLRMHVVLPPSDVGIEAVDLAAQLRWSPSADSIEGYHVYRSGAVDGDFMRLTADLIEDTLFIDPAPLKGRNIYMIRAVKLETTASGTYFNPSQGILDSVFVPDTKVEEPARSLPCRWALLQNYPNPFNASTAIRFCLGRRTKVKLSIFNIAGQRIRQLVDEEKETGDHRVVWDGRDQDGTAVSSGVYFYRLSTADGFSSARAMVLLR